MKRSNPYLGMPRQQYWSDFQKKLDNTAVPKSLWNSKFSITSNSKIVSFGSCFAQHISNFLKQSGYNWLCTEDLPQRVPDELAKSFGYRVFSCRTGNIYTPKMLNQWTSWSIKEAEVTLPIIQKGKKFLDPIRPTIESEGFKSPDEMKELRDFSFNCFYNAIHQADVFVFTLGLTESWRSKRTKEEYSICPLALGLDGISEEIEFYNHNIESTCSELHQAIDKINLINPNINIILTVSPVPLIATQTDRHVLMATMESKMILREACSRAMANFKNVDYFPSYEIVTNPYDNFDYFEKDRRHVKSEGVARVMKQFKTAIEPYRKSDPDSLESTEIETAVEISKSEEVCDEELLVAFDNAGKENA